MRPRSDIEHTFAIPVFGAAPGLAALIESLRAQTGLRSEVLLASSTPSTELKAFSERYGLPLHINSVRLDIATDWNFALSKVQTPLATLAHQDDLFAPTYAAALSGALRRHPAAQLAFCDYTEHTPLGVRPININLRIKRLIRNLAFRAREQIDTEREKVRLLCLGNPICCPSVMLDRSKLGGFRFPSGFSTNLDWMAWLDLARRPGGFVYVRESLVSKGVHRGSETTTTIASRVREREDRALFDSLWPKPVAAVLAAFYKFGYRANRY
jgi:Glycosyl transferase family 2